MVGGYRSIYHSRGNLPGLPHLSRFGVPWRYLASEDWARAPQSSPQALSSFARLSKFLLPFPRCTAMSFPDHCITIKDEQNCSVHLSLYSASLLNNWGHLTNTLKYTFVKSKDILWMYFGKILKDIYRTGLVRKWGIIFYIDDVLYM